MYRLLFWSRSVPSQNIPANMGKWEARQFPFVTLFLPCIGNDMQRGSVNYTEKKLEENKMAFDFKKVAQENTSLSAIMVGREKIDTDDVVNKELTIIAFDFAPKFDKEGHAIVDESTGEADTFGVVVFKEIPDSYYCVGTVFTKVCKAWAAGFDSPEEASKALESEGGVKVKFTPSKTKKGNNLTAVQILN